MEFLGLPEFIWNLIFTLITTLIGGLIIALVTSTFLKKEKSELELLELF